MSFIWIQWLWGHLTMLSNLIVETNRQRPQNCSRCTDLAGVLASLRESRAEHGVCEVVPDAGVDAVLPGPDRHVDLVQVPVVRRRIFCKAHEVGTQNTFSVSSPRVKEVRFLVAELCCHDGTWRVAWDLACGRAREL